MNMLVGKRSGFINMDKSANDKSKWTWKQKINTSVMQTPFIGPAYFVGTSFLLAGFRDGEEDWLSQF
jgi:hypothetical protein